MFTNPFEFFRLRNSITDSDGNHITDADGYPSTINVGFQLTFYSVSVALISNVLAERMKFPTWLILAGFWAALVYFSVAFMVWGGGLPSHSVESFSVKSFRTADGETSIAPISLAGGTVVYIVAGTAILVLVIIVGKRRPTDSSQHRPHNLSLVMLGATLLWLD